MRNLMIALLLIATTSTSCQKPDMIVPIQVASITSYGTASLVIQKEDSKVAETLAFTPEQTKATIFDDGKGNWKLTIDMKNKERALSFFVQRNDNYREPVNVPFCFTEESDIDFHPMASYKEAGVNYYNSDIAGFIHMQDGIVTLTFEGKVSHPIFGSVALRKGILNRAKIVYTNSSFK